ncbi:hypothetical protein LCGC14_0357960 [marine sediment metagenome]|uniref:Uncharacterized protein n=1 Tax=marine sediment metagenome TaxID=412755 RepID=A0A0F9T8V5_9ZZZZ
MNEYYKERKRKNVELIECSALFCALMLVVAAGIALWQYVSPWAVACVLCLNVGFALGVWWASRNKENDWVRKPNRESPNNA